MADEIIQGSEFSQGSFYEHLTLLHLLGGNGLKRDLDVARNFAEQIEPNGGSDFPLYFLTRHKFSNQTTVEEIIKMLERNFFEGKGAASFVLAAIAEVRGDIVNQYKWTTICSMICSDSIKERLPSLFWSIVKKDGSVSKIGRSKCGWKNVGKVFCAG